MILSPVVIQDPAEAVRTRAELLNKINASVHELNEQFINNPQELNTRTLRKLISQLIETNRTLEAQKQGLHETWWNKNGDKISLLFLGIIGLGGIMLTITNIFQFTPSIFATDTQTQCANSTSTASRMIPANLSRTEILRGVTALIINRVARNTIGTLSTTLQTRVSPNPFDSQALQVITAFIILGIVCQIVGGIGSIVADRKDKRELEIRQNLDSVMQVKQVGEEYLERILIALDEYKSKPKEERDPEQIKKCVRAIDKMPKMGIVKIKKENLIPHMIEGLPEDNPLFIDFTNLKRTSKHPIRDEPDNGMESVFIRDEASLTDSTDSSIGGEQMTAAQSMPALNDLKAKKFLKPQQNYKKLWGKVEKQLGISMKKLRIGEQFWHKDGAMVDIPQISNMGNVLRVSRSNSESETPSVIIQRDFETNVTELVIEIPMDKIE